jgi:hypothetical protein
MGKDNHKGPDFLVPIPYIPDEEKEADPSDGKPPSIKLLQDADGKKIDNPSVQAQPIFNGGTTEHFFKWFQSLSSLLDGQRVGEHYRLALQSLSTMNTFYVPNVTVMIFDRAIYTRETGKEEGWKFKNRRFGLGRVVRSPF